MNPSPGQIIIVNGTSGSGKSTACERFAREAQDYWLLYGIDHFTANSVPARFGHHGPKADEGIRAHPVDPAAPDGPLRWSLGPKGLQTFAVFHEWIAAAARGGLNIIADHLLLSDPPIVQDLVWRLDGLPVLIVTLKPPYDVLEQRIFNRAFDKKVPTHLLGEDAVARMNDRLNRLRPWFYEEVYRNPIADLEVDTDRHDPAQVCGMIAKRLAEGPGTAAGRLRSIWPRPF